MSLAKRLAVASNHSGQAPIDVIGEYLAMAMFIAAPAAILTVMFVVNGLWFVTVIMGVFATIVTVIVVRLARAAEREAAAMLESLRGAR